MIFSSEKYVCLKSKPMCVMFLILCVQINNMDAKALNKHRNSSNILENISFDFVFFSLSQNGDISSVNIDLGGGKCVSRK